MPETYLVELIIPSVIILILLLLSAIFSGAETALTAISEPFIHELVKKNHTRAKIVQHLLNNKEKLITTILLGNNLVNTAATAFATVIFTNTFGKNGVFFATVFMTFSLLVFSEISPKTYALRNTETFALNISPLIQAFVWIASPITWTITKIISTFLYFTTPTQPVLCDTVRSLYELRGAIDLHAPSEDILTTTDNIERKKMLYSVLDLNKIEVDDILCPRGSLAMINFHLSIQEILAFVTESSFSRFPVWQNKHDNIIGILHIRNLLQLLQEKNFLISHEDLKSILKKPWVIPEGQNLLDQLHAFRKQKEHFALIVNEYGTLMGIITLEDILEEIVGDINDEHDQASNNIQSLNNKEYIIKGNTTLRDLHRQFDWVFPVEDISTLAGLIIHESRRIPDVGEIFHFYDFHFTILEKERNKLITIQVSPPDPTIPSEKSS